MPELAGGPAHEHRRSSHRQGRAMTADRFLTLADVGEVMSSPSVEEPAELRVRDVDMSMTQRVRTAR
jgi:hypothetical protein